MAYTQTDIANASKYAAQRTKLATIGLMYKKYPHLASHFQYTIRQASDTDDYYFPSWFEDRAIMTHVEISKKLCDKLSCNYATPSGNCKSNTIAQYYRIGDQAQFDRMCQPACFNLTNNHTFDKDGAEIAQMTRLVYNNGVCAIAPPTATWSEMPFYRSTEKYELRVNDLPVGFNKTINKFTASGLSYNYNKPYCDSFFDSFDPVNKICTTKWYEEILNVVVGENIIKLVKAGVTSIKNSGSTLPLPENLPPIPEIEKEFLLDNWLSDIDPTFVVPNPWQNLSDFKQATNVAASPLENIKFPKLPPQNGDIAITLRKTLDNQIGRLADKYTTPTPLNADNLQADIAQILAKLLETILTDPMFIGSVAVDIIMDKTLSLIKNQAKHIVETTSPAIFRLLSIIKGPISRNVFTAALKTTMGQMVTRLTLKLVGSVVTALARIVALTSSVVGIVLIIVSVFDVILAFWDVLGFNKKYPPNYIDDIMTQADLALRKEFQMSVPRIEFDTLTTILLTQEEILQLSIESFGFVFEYLDSLTVNSEGARIDHGDVIIVDIAPDEVQPHFDELLAQKRIYTPADIVKHEQALTNRWRLSNATQKIGIAVIFVAVLLIVIQSQFIAIIFATLAIVILLISQLNLEGDFLAPKLDQDILNNVFRYTRS